MTVEDFGAEVSGWLASTSHPQLRRPYLSCAFVPMVELLRYLEANGFATYITSGATGTSCGPWPGSCTGSCPSG